MSPSLDDLAGLVAGRAQRLGPRSHDTCCASRMRAFIDALSPTLR